MKLLPIYLLGTIQSYMISRSNVSQYTANKDLRYLRAAFNHGLKRGWIQNDPTKDVTFMPVEKRIRYVPSTEDVYRVIAAAKPEIRDYLWVLKETLGRMNEINRLVWNDIDFDDRFVILYTRKKLGGHLTPRKVPMTQKLYDVLANRYKNRDQGKSWVFWQRYWDRK
jgi:integrase